MDPIDLTKHLPEVVSVAKVAAASVPFTAIVKKMLGPAADELAEMWRDQMRLYRYGRQIKCIEKAEKMASDAGFTPRAVPIKLLFPLLEGASLEEDENLNDMWAALLANAASPHNATKVRAGFVETLKQMSPDEGALLNCFLDPNLSNEVGLQYLPPSEIKKITDAYVRLGFPSDQFWVCMEGLEMAKLLLPAGGDHYVLSNRGIQFLRACRPPQPKP